MSYVIKIGDSRQVAYAELHQKSSDDVQVPSGLHEVTEYGFIIKRVGTSVHRAW